jgi:hypothetical protein
MAPLVLRFGKAYTNLQPRITKTLINAFLDLSRPLTTHYGAIVGLSSLGHYVTQLLILPNLKSYLTLLEPELNGTNAIRRLEAKKCYGALLVRVHTHTHTPVASCLSQRTISESGRALSGAEYVGRVCGGQVSGRQEGKGGRCGEQREGGRHGDGGRKR